MRIGIYANIHPDSAAGGTQVYMGGLIKALGTLTEGSEEYLILSSEAHSHWLRELLGPNQRLVTFVDRKAGVGFRCARKATRLLRNTASRALNQIPFFSGGFQAHLESEPAPSKQCDLPFSNGWIESLGLSVIHFPYQYFVVCSVPSVFNPHDLQHLHLPQLWPPRTVFWRESVYPVACRLATRVAVAANWVAADLTEKYAIPQSKIRVIPFAPATAVFAAPNPADVALLKRELHLQQPFILYPAVAWPHKNHSRLIEALALLRKKGFSQTLVFSGAPTPLTPRLERLATELCGPDQVRFLGVVPSHQMRALYAAATLVAVPTLFEAASGPIVEAWQEGTPVVCSDIPQLRGQADGAVLFFDPFNPEHMAACIARLLGDGPLRSQLVAKGHEKLSSVNWAATATQYRELYREVARCCGTA